MHFVKTDSKNIVVGFVEIDQEEYLNYIKITEEQAEKIKTSDKVFEYKNKRLKELTAEQSKGYAPLFNSQNEHQEMDKLTALSESVATLYEQGVENSTKFSEALAIIYETVMDKGGAKVSGRNIL